MKVNFYPLPPVLIALLLAVIYLRTLAPGLTWMFDGADGGDFLTAIATGGVPHPTGYPTYLLLLSSFTSLPMGALDWEANLFSAICTVLAALVVYGLALEMTQDRLASSAASLAYGLFPLVWSQAIITEVYALQGLLTALTLYFLLQKPELNMLTGILAGLTVGNHLTGVFLLPLLWVNPTKQRAQRLLRRLVGLLLGLSVYLILPLRAQAHAPVNWGLATDWDGWLWLVSGQMYRARLQHFDVHYLLLAAGSWARLLFEQLGIAGIFVGLLGLVFSLTRARESLALIWLFASASAFSILYYSTDAHVYLLPALLAFSLWIARGTQWLAANTPVFHHKWLAGIFMLLFILVRAFLAFPGMDLSNDRGPAEFAKLVLQRAPVDAILVTQGDEDTFSLWYFHYALQQRPDLVVISEPLYKQDWYRDILQYTYTDVVIPDGPELETLLAENNERTCCLLSGHLSPKMDCRP